MEVVRKGIDRRFDEGHGSTDHHIAGQGVRAACGTFIIATATTMILRTGRENRGVADVTAVDVTRSSDGTHSFDVTVQHADEGWKHYANRWEIVAPDGQILGTRTLYHPHVSEQPFTRSLSGVEIPRSISRITVRAHDLVHGSGGKEMVLEVPR